MEIIIADNYEEMGRKAAEVVEDCMDEVPGCVLGLATGSTPISMYDALAADCDAGKISFKDVTTFNLDEYLGIPKENDQSYDYFMNKNLFSRVDLAPGATHLPNGNAADGEAACAVYEQMIEDAGGIDLQVLGIGGNGHIGFNEPADNFPVTTHLVDLDERTIKDNSRFFASIEDVPTQAITMGIGTIMKARRIVILANGPKKAEIVKEAFFGPVVPEVPASVLQLHPEVTVVLDKEAAAKIEDMLL